MDTENFEVPTPRRDFFLVQAGTISGYREVIAGEFSPTIASFICFKATWAAAISSSATSNDQNVASETYDQFFVIYACEQP